MLLDFTLRHPPVLNGIAFAGELVLGFCEGGELTVSAGELRTSRMATDVVDGQVRTLVTVQTTDFLAMKVCLNDMEGDSQIFGVELSPSDPWRLRVLQSVSQEPTEIWEEMFHLRLPHYGSKASSEVSVSRGRPLLQRLLED